MDPIDIEIRNSRLGNSTYGDWVVPKCKKKLMNQEIC